MTIRLGIIGCGDMGESHRSAFAELGDRVRVTATADVDLDRARAAADHFGAELATTDYRDTLDAVDAVLVVTPHDLHAEMGLTALRAGKHVLMEKPMAVSEQECLDLIAESSDRDLVLMTAYPMRFHPLVRTLKDLVDQRLLGDPFHMSIWTEQLTMPAEGHWIRSAKRLGGGQLFSHGCHYVDLLLWFLGRPERGTHMGSRLGTPWMEREGTSDLIMAFESGITGYHFGTWGARASRMGYSIHVHCVGGMLEADLTNGRLYAHHGWGGPAPRGGLAETLLPPADAGELLVQTEADDKHLGGEIVHFVECVETGQRPLTDGPGSLQGLRVIWRLYEAEERGLVADLRGLGLDEDWRGAGRASLPG